MEDRHLPEQGRAIRASGEPGGGHDRLDVRGRMNIEAEPSTQETRRRVEDAPAEPDPPRVPRIDETDPSPGAGDRRLDECLHVGIAAYDAVERDEIRRVNLWRHLDEVSRDVPDTIGNAAPLRFAQSRFNVR